MQRLTAIWSGFQAYFQPWWYHALTVAYSAHVVNKVQNWQRARATWPSQVCLGLINWANYRSLTTLALSDLQVYISL